MNRPCFCAHSSSSASCTTRDIISTLSGRPAFAQLADKSWVRLVYGEADCNFQIDPKKPNSKPYAQFAIGDCKRRPSCGH